MAALNLAARSAGARLRSCLMPCALAHSQTSVVFRPLPGALDPVRAGRRALPARWAALPEHQRVAQCPGMPGVQVGLMPGAVQREAKGSGISPAAPDIPGPCGSGITGGAFVGLSLPMMAAISPHRPSEPRPDFFESCHFTWSPVTESNRRPSPYHACRFRLMASGWVGLPQVGRLSVSGRVGPSLLLPEGVVTWFVTWNKSFR
jgi:hypothetical protein